MIGWKESMQTGARCPDTAWILPSEAADLSAGRPMRYDQWTTRRDYGFEQGVLPKACANDESEKRPDVKSGLFRFTRLDAVSNGLLSPSPARIIDEPEQPKLFRTCGTKAKVVFSPQPRHSGWLSAQVRARARFSYVELVLGVVPALGLKLP